MWGNNKTYFEKHVYLSFWWFEVLFVQIGCSEQYWLKHNFPKTFLCQDWVFKTCGELGELWQHIWIRELVQPACSGHVNYVHFLKCILGCSKDIFKDLVHLIPRSYSQSKISHLNAKWNTICIHFCSQVIRILKTVLHFYGTFTFSDIFLTKCEGC